MLLRLDFLASEDRLDTMIGIDDEGRSLGAHILSSVHTLLYPGAEELVELYIGICDQTEGEAVLLAEALVALGRVTADADDLIACLPELAVSVPETACLGGTSGGIILGVKVEDDPLTRVL